MAKSKTTVYVDEAILRAARVYAARKDLHDSEVIETALRRLLGLDLLESVWERTREDVAADEAEHIAYSELTASRKGRRAGSRRHGK